MSSYTGSSFRPGSFRPSPSQSRLQSLVDNGGADSPRSILSQSPPIFSDHKFSEDYEDQFTMSAVNTPAGEIPPQLPTSRSRRALTTMAASGSVASIASRDSRTSTSWSGSYDDLKKPSTMPNYRCSQPMAIEMPSRRPGNNDAPTPTAPLSARGDLPGGYFPNHEDPKIRIHRPHPFHADVKNAKRDLLERACRQCAIDHDYCPHTGTPQSSEAKPAKGSFRPGGPREVGLLSLAMQGCCPYHAGQGGAHQLRPCSVQQQEPCHVQPEKSCDEQQQKQVAEKQRRPTLEKQQEPTLEQQQMPILEQEHPPTSISSYNPAGFPDNQLPMGKYYPTNWENRKAHKKAKQLRREQQEKAIDQNGPSKSEDQTSQESGEDTPLRLKSPLQKTPTSPQTLLSPPPRPRKSSRSPTMSPRIAIIDSSTPYPRAENPSVTRAKLQGHSLSDSEVKRRLQQYQRDMRTQVAIQTERALNTQVQLHGHEEVMQALNNIPALQNLHLSPTGTPMSSSPAAVILSTGNFSMLTRPVSPRLQPLGSPGGPMTPMDLSSNLEENGLAAAGRPRMPVGVVSAPPGMAAARERRLSQEPGSFPFGNDTGDSQS